jgi:ferric-dicitrate binding protein FerR (iron transport regulator)
MSKEEAIKVLEQALNAANLKGIFSLADVEVILNALNIVKED